MENETQGWPLKTVKGYVRDMFRTNCIAEICWGALENAAYRTALGKTLRSWQSLTEIEQQVFRWGVVEVLTNPNTNEARFAELYAGCEEGLFGLQMIGSRPVDDISSLPNMRDPSYITLLKAIAAHAASDFDAVNPKGDDNGQN